MVNRRASMKYGFIAPTEFHCSPPRDMTFPRTLAAANGNRGRKIYVRNGASDEIEIQAYVISPCFLVHRPRVPRGAVIRECVRVP